MHVFFPPRLIHTPDPISQGQLQVFLNQALQAYALGGSIIVSDEDSFTEALKIVNIGRGFPEGSEALAKHREWRRKAEECYAGLDGCPNIRDAIAQSQDPAGGLAGGGE